MRTGIAPYLKWRLLDIAGNVIVDPLPHPHQSRFEIWGCQLGMPGAATIGSFSIPLWPPSSDRYKLAKVDYDKITYAQRAEAYLSASPQDVAGAWGDPKFSGIITRTQKDTLNYSIGGEDSLWWAQKSMTGRTDLFSDTTDNLLRYGFKAYKLVYGDGDQTVATSWTSGNYTNDGTWTFNISDDGFKTVKAGGGGDGLLYTASYGNTNYADMYVEASFHLHCDTAASATSEASVIAAVADSNNFIMGQVLLRQVTSTSWSVSPAIWQKSGGVYALGITAQAFTVNTADRRLQVRLVGYQKSSTVYSWRVLVNGTDTNCLWDQTVGVGSPTGGVGLRSSHGGSGSASNAWATQLVFMNKSRIFQDGTINAGSVTVNEVLSSMPLIDLWNMAATIENRLWIKNPKAATTTTPFPDTVDFPTAGPGVDRSASVFFKEGENLSNLTISPNAEGLSTGVTVQGTGSMDGSGQFNYYNLSKIGTLGLLIDSAAAQGVSDNVALRQYAARILANRSNPSAAITADVVRDVDTADGWRELDTVSLYAPRLYLQNSAQQIVGYDLQEGVPTQQVTFAQYPTGGRWAWIRLMSVITMQLRQKNEVRGVV